MWVSEKKGEVNGFKIGIHFCVRKERIQRKHIHNRKAKYYIRFAEREKVTHAIYIADQCLECSQNKNVFCIILYCIAHSLEEKKIFQFNTRTRKKEEKKGNLHCQTEGEGMYWSYLRDTLSRYTRVTYVPLETVRWIGTQFPTPRIYFPSLL